MRALANVRKCPFWGECVDVNYWLPQGWYGPYRAWELAQRALLLTVGFPVNDMGTNP